MTIIRLFLRGLGLVVALFLLAGWLPAQFGAYGLFWERYTSLFLNNPADPTLRWHQPLEVVAGSATAPVVIAPEEATAFRPGVLEEVAAYARAYNSDSLVVMHRGRFVFEQYWNTRKAHSLANGHSMAKTLVALLVGQALAEGRIASIDDPAYYFLAEWDREPYRQITVRHLLQMTSGLRDERDLWPWSARTARFLGLDIEAANLATAVESSPGKQFSHIDPPAQVLAIIIERATGRRFAEYLAEKIWRPLGAQNAAVLLDRPGGMAHADCCMWATPQDWARVGELLRMGGMWNGAVVVPPAWIDQMLMPIEAYPNFGMMLWLGNVFERERRYQPGVDLFLNRQSERFLSPTYYLDGVHGQRVWIVPEKELVIVRTGRAHPDWDDALLPNMLIRGMVQ